LAVVIGFSGVNAASAHEDTDENPLARVERLKKPPPQRAPQPKPAPAPAPPAPTIGTYTGCLMRQVWDVQSIDTYTLQIWLGAGPEQRFTFQPDRVDLIHQTGTPLTSREQANKYDMIARSIEAAGNGRRPITIQYETATRRVFGITIEWNGAQCP
jgi:hypothetical protein